MGALVTAEANRLLDATFGTAAFAAPTGAMKLALVTATGSAAAAGTEVTGGSYARQTLVMGSASGSSCANTSTISFTGMPAATVTGVDIYDSNGTPRRAWWGALTASKTVGAGDTLSFASSSITASF
ncbi:phage tail fiber protein [Dactylosporangium salmoneum]|uniref:Uncharacterized protein n=1 Tax=Dactylosporangium salmoneum TaxID=53361 RepID=A0ABN3G9C3_9ACTN